MESKNKTTIHKENFFSEFTEESVYMLGYLEADGSFKIDKETIRVYFQTTDKDISFLEKLKQTVGYSGKLGISKNIANKKIYYKARFTVSSKAWKKDLDKIGYRNNKIPDIPDSLIHHYIRGYFDGDGSIYFEKQSLKNKSNFVFSSQKLAEQFKDILDSKGIRSSNIHKKSNSNQCWYFTLSYKQTEKLREFMYQGGSLYLERKYKAFLNNYIVVTN